MICLHADGPAKSCFLQAAACSMEFKAYLTSKTQGWFRRWGCNKPATAPVASPAPCAGAWGAGSATPAHAPTMQVSDDDKDGGGLERGLLANSED